MSAARLDAPSLIAALRMDRSSDADRSANTKPSSPRPAGTSGESVLAAWGEPADDRDAIGGAFCFRFAAARQAHRRGAARPRRRPRARPTITIPTCRRAMPMSRSISGCAKREDRRADPPRHARHAGMAAGQGGGAVGETAAPEAVLGPAAGDLSVHRQQSGRGGAGQAPLGAVTIGHLTPPLSAAGAARAPRSSSRRLIDEYRRGRRPRSAPRARHLRRRSSSGAGRAALPRNAPLTARRRSEALVAARRLALRRQGHADPRRPACLRPVARERRAASLALASSAGGERRAGRARGRLRRGRARGAAGARSTDASSRPARPARRRAAGSTCCRPAATSTPIDPRAVPTRTAWEIGRRAAEESCSATLQDHGDWPRRIVHRPLGLGHHAHRRRRSRPGLRAPRRAGRSGTRLQPRHRLRGLAARRCSTARAST